VAVGVLVVILGGGVAYVLSHAPGNVSHPNVQFTAPASTTTTTTTTAHPPTPAPVADTFQWPWYGFDNGRTRDFSGPAALHPPLHVGWRFFDGGLLEFPPAIYHETMFLLDDNGSAKAVNLHNGGMIWHDKVGTLAAASPAVDGGAGLVLMPVLATTGHAPGNGRFVALSMKTGAIVWSRPSGAGSESSPIISGRTVYYGDNGGTLSARDVVTGHLDWTFHASGPIKGGPALSGGVLYFGDYSGHVYAVRATDGRQIWSVGTDGTHFGFGSGNFYSTPAVVFGRVFIGNTDGYVYSFGERTGALAWSTATGAYVYASPAVADPPGVGPTVYAGSYDGNLYAFDARTGAIRWRHDAGGRISGSATVVGNTVYFSDLANKTTTGLDAATGQTVFTYPDGAFSPVIADDQAIYLVGYLTVYQMLPTAPAPKKAAPHAARPHRSTHTTTSARRSRKAPSHPATSKRKKSSKK
jgi:outer membrane protein assembly factor BamB